MEQISVNGVPVLKQPKSMACWITVYAMLVSKHDHHAYSVQEAAKKAGEPWYSRYLQNTGLAQEDEESFYAVVGYTTLEPANHTAFKYKQIFDEHGPIGITTGDWRAKWRHARVIADVIGGGSNNTTLFHVIDPSDGSHELIGANKFLAQFEREARQWIDEGLDWELPIQIYYF